MNWIDSFGTRSQRRRTVQALAIVIGLVMNLSLSSCISWQEGAAPIYPEGSGTFSDPYVDSLRPTFKWANPLSASEMASNIQQFSYEFRLAKCKEYGNVWRGGHTGRGWEGRGCTPMYERTGLTEASHQVEVTLEPGWTYCWRVRATYKKDGTPHYSDWSGRTVGLWAATGLCNWFRTPQQRQEG
jgi:hypothetical protein